jgi:protein disulfide-isomerase
MNIDIWSDIMCPFCYIGKRKLEAALNEFEHKDEVTVKWHSFQLDPTLQSQPGTDLYGYVAEHKGQSREWSVGIHGQLTNTAAENGLEYHFEKAVIANSFDAHRLIQLAKKHGLDGAAEEQLFKAYFTDGKDISNHNTLMQVGIDIGLRAVEVGEMLNSDAYAEAVHADIAHAQELGIRGVPFFAVNDRYAISGAQPKEAFLQTLQHAWKEYAHASVTNELEDGICTPDGSCAVK